MVFTMQDQSLYMVFYTLFPWPLIESGASRLWWTVVVKNCPVRGSNRTQQPAVSTIRNLEPGDLALQGAVS